MWEFFINDKSRLFQPIESLPAIGPKRGASFREIGITSVLDLLKCPPNRYIHRKSAIPIAEISSDETATIFARIRSIKRSLKTLALDLEDDSGRASAVFFNAPAFMAKGFSRGDEILLWGRSKVEKGLRVFIHPDFELGGEDFAKFIPIYPLSDKLKFTTKLRAKLVESALNYLEDIYDPISEEHRKICGIVSLPEAIYQIHAPKSWAEIESASNRLAFDELFLAQILFALRRHSSSKDLSAEPLRPGTLFSAAKSSLPFKLTEGQNRALAGILQQMTCPGVSQQLLSGDVGSGKTALALLVSAVAVDTGLQVAFMVPSTLLARQHADLFAERLGRFGARIGLLTGASTSKALEKGLAEGTVDIVIGTQALLSEKRRFKKLGLIIIDEQHRFGVNQRMALTMKAGAHILLMSATPIPRTSALALYGDLDLEVLEGFPSQRAGFKTYIREESARPAIWDFIEDHISKGERAFVVHPRIEGEDLSSVKTAFSALAEKFGNKISILHGNLSDDEKSTAFDDFRSGNKPVIAATNVIEVGVDIPEATVMVIEAPESFGLAQLHQLRGRIGRGQREGYCILVTRSEIGSPSRKRIELFAATSDGFAISELDLSQRGEGRIFDLAQSGTAAYRFAEPLKMPELISAARLLADIIVSDDPNLSKEKNLGLNTVIKYLYSSKNFIKLAV